MAVTAAVSPSSFPQSSTGRLEVTSVLARSYRRMTISSSSSSAVGLPKISSRSNTPRINNVPVALLARIALAERHVTLLYSAEKQAWKNQMEFLVGTPSSPDAGLCVQQQSRPIDELRKLDLPHDSGLGVKVKAGVKFA